MFASFNAIRLLSYLSLVLALEVPYIYYFAITSTSSLISDLRGLPLAFFSLSITPLLASRRLDLPLDRISLAIPYVKQPYLAFFAAFRAF